MQDYMIQYTKAHNELTKRKEFNPESFRRIFPIRSYFRFELKQATRGYTKYVKKEAKFFKKFNAVREKEISSIEPAGGAVIVFKDQKDALVMGSVQIDDQFGQWQTMQAPGPSDLVCGTTSRVLETGERLEDEPNSFYYYFHDHFLHVPGLI